MREKGAQMLDKETKQEDSTQLSDAEIAWKLHQELNAVAPMLRTRSRKVATTGEPAGKQAAPKTEPDAEETGAGISKEVEQPKETPVEPVPRKRKVTAPTPVVASPEAPVAQEEPEKPAPPAKRKATKEQAAKPKPAAQEKEVPKEPEPAPALAPAVKPRSRKNRPVPAVEGGERPAPPPPPPPKPVKLPKIPKLPMVRQGKQWYRARLIKETEEKALVEFAGFEHVLPTLWLRKDSDRIWLGSYKGKDWRYLGEGAWEPKAGVNNKILPSSGNGGQDSGDNQNGSGGSGKRKEPKEEEGHEGLDRAEDEFMVVDGPVPKTTHPEKEKEKPRQRQAKRSAPETNGTATGGDLGDQDTAPLQPLKKSRKDTVAGGSPRHQPLTTENRLASKVAASIAGDPNHTAAAGSGDNDALPSHRSSSEPQAISSPRAAAAALKALERDGSPNGSLRGSGGSGGSKDEQQGAGAPDAGGSGRRRRGRPPRALAGNGMKRSAAGNHAGAQESNLLTRQRPHRSARKAQLYTQEEFDLDAGEDIDIEPTAAYIEEPTSKKHNINSPTYLAAVANAGGGGGSGGEGNGVETAGAQQPRRRRKPLVASPAPTDVGPIEFGPNKDYNPAAAPPPVQHMVATPSPAVDVLMPTQHHPQPQPRNMANGNGIIEAVGAAAAAAGASHHQIAYHNEDIPHDIPVRRRKPAPTAAAALDHSPPLPGYGTPRGNGNAYEGSGRSRHADRYRSNGHYHGTNGNFSNNGGNNSIATAEQMFGQLLGAIASRLGKKGGPTGPVNGEYHEFSAALEREEDLSRPLKWGWAAIKGAPAIMNVDADLLRAALPRRGSLEAAEDKLYDGGKKPAVPLFC